MESQQTFPTNRSRLAWRSVAFFAVITGGLTQFVDFPGVVANYWFDMAFPVFIYIYLRKKLKTDESHGSSRIQPNLALILTIGPAFILETLQYFNWYKGTIDLIDYLAYISLVIPAYLIDRRELASRIQIK